MADFLFVLTLTVFLTELTAKQHGKMGVRCVD